MSPVVLRPIREQFEHDRVIRLLQTRLRRRYAVAVNIGDEPEPASVRVGSADVYPDLVLTVIQGPRRLHGVVEVETAESVNRLEAMAEWGPFGKVRGTFYLYVPAGTTDVTRRLCEEHQISVTEIWSYHAVGDQMRFTMTHRSAQASAAARAKAKRAGKATPRASNAVKESTKTARTTKTSAAKSVSATGRGPAGSTARARGSGVAVKRSVPTTATAAAAKKPGRKTTASPTTKTQRSTTKPRTPSGRAPSHQRLAAKSAADTPGTGPDSGKTVASNRSRKRGSGTGRK